MRVLILTLFEAGLKPIDIARQLHHTTRQVSYALRHRLNPQKHKCGPSVSVNTPNRRRIVDWVTNSAKARCTPMYRIADNWKLSETLLRPSLKKEGCGSYFAKIKPNLNERNAAARLKWCRERLYWTYEEWQQVPWTDETWVNPDTQ